MTELPLQLRNAIQSCLDRDQYNHEGVGYLFEKEMLGGQKEVDNEKGGCKIVHNNVSIRYMLERQHGRGKNWTWSEGGESIRINGQVISELPYIDNSHLQLMKELDDRAFDNLKDERIKKIVNFVAKRTYVTLERHNVFLLLSPKAANFLENIHIG